jgi:uncharacterized protein YutE (UPF0331/DUF86 family)
MPSRSSRRVAGDRLALIDPHPFFADRRNVGTAESCRRRSLEALLDIGWHILAHADGIGVSEYREIAARLVERQALVHEEATLLGTLAGYSNRMMHVYHEIVAPDELDHIYSTQLGDVERIADPFRRWVSKHPEQVSDEL